MPEASAAQRQLGPRLRRSMLITPGDRADRLARASQLRADSIVFDLEDGVAPPHKPAARRHIAEALRALEFGGRERVVRTNAVSTAEFADDLEAVPWEHVDTILLPKVESARDIGELAARLDDAERSRSRARPLEIVASIETPRGLLNALDIAEASPRTTALFFGSGDYAMATGCALTERALAMPRALIVAAAAAQRMAAIDAAYFLHVKDAEGTRADARIARELGFSGKLVFHPTQIDVCNEVFTPAAPEIARAQRIIKAWRRAGDQRHGTIFVDGEFIAIDIVLMAERTLAAARAADVGNPA